MYVFISTSWSLNFFVRHTINLSFEVFLLLADTFLQLFMPSRTVCKVLRFWFFFYKIALIINTENICNILELYHIQKTFQQKCHSFDRSTGVRSIHRKKELQSITACVTIESFFWILFLVRNRSVARIFPRAKWFFFIENEMLTSSRQTGTH